MEYFVSKLSFREEEKLIKDVFVYEYNNNKLNEGENKPRDWIVTKMETGNKVSTMSKNVKGQWTKGNEFVYEKGLFTWRVGMPKNAVKRKTFVSYYHKDDQEYRELFENLFNDLIVSKSVEKDDIDEDNSDEYIKQLIQKEYLSDTTVLLVLIGPKTKCRMHVDWEISGALNIKVGDNYAGLVGILLPTHPDFGKAKPESANLPARLAANFESGYALVYDWTIDRVEMQTRLEIAFNKRSENYKIKNKSIPQMTKDQCE